MMLNSNSWIVQNLKHYGNSLIPNKLLTTCDIITLERELTHLVGREVKIRQTEEKYRLYKLRRTDSNFIALRNSVMTPLIIAEIQRH